MRSRAVLSLLLLTLLSVSAATARAQDSSGAVEALFQEGKRLKDEGKFAEACPKFLASYNLEIRLGTLLNLADCYEKNNQLASAWARFVEARTLASRSGETARVEFASKHADALEPKLSKLTLNAPKPSPGTAITLDGVTVDPGAFGVAVAVDAGRHVIDASAPGKQPWKGEVVVGEDADRKVVEIPELLDAPKPPSADVATEKRGVSTRGGGISTRGVVGLVLAGAGVVSLGVGGYFGVAALGKNSDSRAFCGQNGRDANDCTSEGVALRSTAVRDATLSTIFLSAGAVVAAAGLVVFITDPGSRSKARIGIDGRGLRLSGAF
jgi:hypothetical protein